MLNMGFSIIACENWNELRRPTTAISTSTPLHPTPRTLLGSGWTRWESEPDYSYPITLIKRKRNTLNHTTNFIVIIIFTAYSGTKVMRQVWIHSSCSCEPIHRRLSRCGCLSSRSKQNWGSSAPVSVQVQCSPFLLFLGTL